MFLRFTSLKPSLLEVDDKTRGHDSRVATLAKEFRPRPKDEGKLSTWRVEGPHDEARHVVIHATRAKNSRLDDVQYARVAATWLEELGLQVSASRAADAFECVADLHWEVLLLDPLLVQALADRVLREQERTGKGDASAPLAYVHRSDSERSYPTGPRMTVARMIEDEYARCSASGTLPELSSVAGWARELVIQKTPGDRS